MDENTKQQVEKLAAENMQKNPCLSAVLYAFLGASEEGKESEITAVITTFSQLSLHSILHTRELMKIEMFKSESKNKHDDQSS